MSCEYRYRTDRLVNGIKIPDTIHQKIHEHAGDWKISLAEDLVEAADIQ